MGSSVIEKNESGANELSSSAKRQAKNQNRYNYYYQIHLTAFFPGQPG